MTLAALLGLWLGTATSGDWGQYVVLPALLLMLTAVFVRMDATHVGEVRSSLPLVASSLTLNFIVTPLLAWGLGVSLLAGQPDLRIGLLLLLVTPCTDWYLVFTAMARGHTGIAAALLPVNLVLQLLLLPVYVLLLGGQAAAVDAATLVEAVVIVLGVPLVAALIVRWATSRADVHRPGSRERVDALAGQVIVPALCLAVVAMFAWQAPVVAEHGAQIAALLPPLLVFFVALPLLATLTARVLGLDGPQRVTLTMVVTARNSPIALAIAVVAFPHQPLIAVALVVGPLIELPILAVLSQVARHRERS
ncbi:MAG: arsenic resistance protein [Mobilicoccus sp.]|nr:arsenic resistance protein [Mobilicoccus sp.]